MTPENPIPVHTIELPYPCGGYNRLRFTVIDDCTIHAWFLRTGRPVTQGPIIAIEGRHRIEQGHHHLETFSSKLAQHLLETGP